MTACILLAGGRGTRLREAVPGVPKCLAPVVGTPFLELQLEHLASRGVERFVLALGHLAGPVIKVARALKASFNVEWVVEPHALGTGGAALFAMHRAGLAEALVANADTFLEADLSALFSPLDARGVEHIRMIALQSAEGPRFGAVVVNGGRAEQFLAGGSRWCGPVNAGMYRVHRKAFAGFHPRQAFSLEADVIAGLAAQGRVSVAVVAGRFSDIGVPEDYRRFCGRFAALASNGPAQP